MSSFLTLSTLIAGLLLVAPSQGLAAFDFVEGWGSFGKGDGQFMYPEGVALDEFGHVYVADTENQRVQKFDSEGDFLTKWGLKTEFEGSITPAGIATDAAANVYVVDDSVVQKFDSEGNLLKEWGSFGEGDGQFKSATAIAIDGNGDVYVTDVGNYRVQKFDSEGNFLAGWGSEGSGDGQFGTLGGNPFNGVAIDRSDHVYVVDTYNYRVQKFTNYGKFLGKWGSQGSGSGQFINEPWGIASDAFGNVFVSDTGRIQKFTSSGAYLDGFQPSSGGTFADEIPDMAIGATGEIYVVDRINHRIQKFVDIPLPPNASIVQPGSSPTQELALPPPIAGKTVNVAPVTGIVRIRIPGTRRFRRLRAGEQVPVGSILDTTRGRVQLTSALRNGTTQSAIFYQGIFRVAQRARSGLTELRLIGGPPHGCAGKGKRGRSARASARKRRAKRRRRPARLWGKGKGRFRTRGRHGAATVRGTVWFTAERCSGTLFKVKRGRVKVRDFTRRKTRLVRSGQRYLAPSATRRRNRR